MPPASLSTLAVMKPGPTTAKNRTRLCRQLLRAVVVMGLAFVPQHRDDVVGGDDARQPAMLVGDGERQQVVLVEERRHFVVRRVGGARDVRLAQSGERRGGGGGGHFGERDRPDKMG